MQRRYAQRHDMLTAYFFPEAKLENKTTTDKMLQGQGIKAIEVKGQGHFAILLIRKVRFLQCIPNLS